MAIMYTLDEHAIHTPTLPGEPEVEQEHKDSCDINIMIKAAQRGLPIRGSDSNLRYGEDDLTMDAVTHRIKKQALEEELGKIANEHEFSPEELQAIPEQVRKKFNFKTKKPQAEQREQNAIKTPNGSKVKNKQPNEPIHKGQRQEAHSEHDANEQDNSDD